MVIERHQVMPMLLAACPSFEDRWQEHLDWWEGEEAGLYNDLARFAHHLVELEKQGTTREFAEVFHVVERLHVEGDHYVKEAATIGLLEVHVTLRPVSGKPLTSATVAVARVTVDI